MASQILSNYNWTSSAIVYGLLASGSGFYAFIANDYILPHIRQSKMEMQMYSFPVSLVTPVNYEKVIQQIVLLSRGNWWVLIGDTYGVSIFSNTYILLVSVCFAVVFLALPQVSIRQFMVRIVIFEHGAHRSNLVCSLIGAHQ